MYLSELSSEHMTIITMYLNLKPPLSAPCKQRFSEATLSEYKSYVVNISCHQISSHQTVLATQCLSPHTPSYKSEINLTDRGGAWQWNNLNAVCYVRYSVAFSLPSPSPRINYYQQWWRASLATGRCDCSEQSLSFIFYCWLADWLAGCLLFMSSELTDQVTI